MGARLDQVITDLIGREGRYSNDPNDSGGETMWGITIAVARAYGYIGAMRDMPRETAAAIYRQRFWVQPRFNEVALVSAPIADELLDTGVNMGTGIAGRFLQRALNALNKQGTLYPDLTVDGNVGPMTVNALAALIRARGGKDGETVVLRLLNNQQGVRYLELSEAAPKNEEFTFGWVLNRVA